MRLLWLGLCVLCGLSLAFGRPAEAETRVALVVGNGAYLQTTPLANPINDARDVAAALKAAGFSVVEAIDADKRKLDGALRAFTDLLAKADVALFFYAGHGLQVGLQNYLVPIDARLERERDLEFEAVKLDFVLRQMEIDREGKTTIVILDACRDNPLARNLARTMGTRSTAIGRGLAAASTGLGTFIAYSTQPGNVALDGDGRNSPFTAALVRHMRVAGRNLPATMIEVRKDVVAATGGKQVPWDHSALTGDFFFVPGGAASAAASSRGSIAAAPVGSSADLEAMQERLRKLEEDIKRREEEQKRREAAAAQAPPPPPPPRPLGPTAAVPPVTPRATAPQEAASFEVQDNVRIEGLKLGEGRQPSPAACSAECERDAACVAYQHGRKVPVMGVCQLFSRVDGRQQDYNWRSGVRVVSSAPPPGDDTASARALRAIKAKASRRGQGFAIYDGLSIVGEQIKMSATDSPAGCQIVCRNTPGCVAATYNDFFRGKNVACLVYREVTDTMKAPSSTLMLKAD